MWTEYLSVILVILLGLLVLHVAGSSGRQRFPGPPPLPIGNFVPPGHLWKKLAVFSQEYGPVFSLCTFGKLMLIPNLAELAGMGRGVLFESDPNRLRQSRKMLNLILGPRQLETYRAVMEKYVVQFLDNLLESSDKFAEHARRRDRS
ncbi:hypothetical protein A0H81_08933 [Grifola frondosa]|uniref:Uncharacterized protein n=1 Tax=Grifola frondosa TaxID=5627 RepID=A0A1C7M3J3_GRIFR|nr:hypothetical protein A0H81_08933 [Grifola frondosa]